jgi:hypothetical protein
MTKATANYPMLTKATRATRKAAIESIKSGAETRVYLNDTASYGGCTVTYTRERRGVELTAYGPDGQTFASRLVARI